MHQESGATTFHRRNNRDGTVDSICLICFRTVGPAETTLQLSEFERRHLCEDRYQLPFQFEKLLR